MDFRLWHFQINLLQIFNFVVFYPIVVVLSDLYIYLFLFHTQQPQVRKFLQRRVHNQNDIKLFTIIEIKTPTHLLFGRLVELHITVGS